MELDEKVDEPGYGLAFQLSPNCTCHMREMATVGSLGHRKETGEKIQLVHPLLFKGWAPEETEIQP